MAEKVCKKCKMIFEGKNICPNCGSDQIGDSYKGKVAVVNPELSEIAKNLKITKKGEYAAKLG